MSYPGLTGRVVVVTGAAGGQGAAEALLLAASGAQVIATDVVDDAPALGGSSGASGTSRESESRASGAVSDSGRAGEPGVTYRRLDVADERGWSQLASELTALLGGAPLKGLINNAGITHRSRLGETRLDDWQRVLAVNLTGPMLGMQALAPLMGVGSSIVNVGSSAALNGHYPVAYTSSKWGLRGLTHVAATEYGPRGIRVNIIHPGFIETEMTANAPAAMRAAQLYLTPLERFGESQEVAELAAFLISDAASYISGAEIPVDGAFTSSSGAKFMADRIAVGRAEKL